MTFDEKYSVGFCSFQTELILIFTTLYALVKNLFLDIEEADGILITERKVLDCLQSNVELKVKAPQSLRVKYVRAAHIYNITFASIRSKFAVVGLFSKISPTLRFDGAYFQILMNSFANGINLIQPIDTWRIYID